MEPLPPPSPKRGSLQASRGYKDFFNCYYSYSSTSGVPPLWADAKEASVATEGDLSPLRSLWGRLPLSFFFALPCFFSASAMIHCSWPLVERNSSAAHFSMAANVSASMRKTKFFVLLSFSAIIIREASPCPSQGGVTQASLFQIPLLREGLGEASCFSDSKSPS